MDGSEVRRVSLMPHPRLCAFLGSELYSRLYEIISFLWQRVITSRGSSLATFLPGKQGFPISCLEAATSLSSRSLPCRCHCSFPLPFSPSVSFNSSIGYIQLFRTRTSEACCEERKGYRRARMSAPFRSAFLCFLESEDSSFLAGLFPSLFFWLRLRYMSWEDLEEVIIVPIWIRADEHVSQFGS